MKFRKFGAAALALSMLSATTAVVANAEEADENVIISDGLKFSELEDGTLSVTGFAGEELTDVVIPSEVDDKEVIIISFSAFSDCTNLISVTIPDSVTEIVRGAFSNCKSLTDVIIPDSVTRIGDEVFYGCENLTDVYYSGSEDEWNKIIFGDYNDILLNATIHYNYVPETSNDSNSSDSSDSESSDNESSSDSETSSDSSSATETKEFTSGDVTATANDGVVPDGAEFSAELTSDENNEYTYDIKFTKDGEEIQPDGSVTVKLPLPEALKGKTVYVYRVEDGKYTDMKAKVEGDYVVFTTDHFSEYLITAEEKGETTPDTGFGGVAMALGVVALAGAAVVVSRKRK